MTLALAAISAALLAAIAATRRMSVQCSIQAIKCRISAGTPTYRSWDSFLVVSHLGISDPCSLRSYFRRKVLYPVVSRGRTHNGVSGFCTWPRPEMPVFGPVHLGICSLGAIDRVEWVEVETGVRMENTVLMTSHILVRGVPSIPPIQVGGWCL